MKKVHYLNVDLIQLQKQTFSLPFFLIIFSLVIGRNIFSAMTGKFDAGLMMIGEFREAVR